MNSGHHRLKLFKIVLVPSNFLSEVHKLVITISLEKIYRSAHIHAFLYDRVDSSI